MPKNSSYLNMYDVIVIGGGPAGMTAGLYVKRTGKTVLVLESGTFGGQIASSPKIENYPGIKTVSGVKFADNMLDQLISLDVQIELEKVQSVTKNDGTFNTVTEYNTYQSKSIIIATGCKHRQLQTEKDYFKIQSGISYCAVCDGIFYKDKQVAVIGGGDTALQESLYLSDICKKVYLIHRRDIFRGSENLVKSLNKRKNIQIIFNSVVTELVGNKELEGLKIKNLKNNDTFVIDISGVFVAIGQLPETNLFKGMIELDSKGYVISGEDCKTSLEGLFVAGDCRTKAVNQLTTAVSDGAVSAINACRYVDNL